VYRSGKPVTIRGSSRQVRATKDWSDIQISGYGEISGLSKIPRVLVQSAYSPEKLIDSHDAVVEMRPRLTVIEHSIAKNHLVVIFVVELACSAGLANSGGAAGYSRNS
jgi:hypothetical protein